MSTFRSNVGILTDSPTAALDVNGAINIEGDGNIAGITSLMLRGRLPTGSYGPPTSGTWNAGDVLTDAGGAQWLCTTAGTPGTWVSSGTALNVLNYGAKRDYRVGTTASMTSGSSALTDTGAAFTSADVGKMITVVGAGAAGVDLSTTISAVTSGTAITLAANAGTTVSGAGYGYASDDSTAINAAITAANASGGSAFLPAGGYGVGSPIVPMNNVGLDGAGSGVSMIYPFGTAGAVTKQATTGSPLTNFRMSRLGIDGARQVGPYNVATKGVFIQYTSNCTFTDLLIRNTVATGLGIDFLTQGTVVDWVRVIGCGRLNVGGASGAGSNGIGIGTGQHAVEDFTVSNCYASGNGRYGIMIESQTGTCSRGMRFIGCYAVSNLNSGFGDGGGSGAQFIGCVSAQNNQDGFVVDNGTVGATAQPGGNTMFIGCEAIANNRYGFTYNPTATNVTSPSGAGSIKWTGCKAWNNTSLGWFINPISGHPVSGIYLGDCEATGNGASGIQISNSVTDVTITGCQLHSNGQSSATSKTGINITAGTITNLMITGTKISDDGSPQKQTYAIVVASGAGITTGTITGNDFRGNLTGVLSNAGTLTGVIMERNPGGPVAVTYAATQNTDCAAGDVFEVTLTGNVTLANPTNMVDGQRITWRFTQDSTGGRILSMGSAFTGIPLLKAYAGGVDYVQAIYSAATSSWDILNQQAGVGAKQLGWAAMNMDPAIAPSTSTPSAGTIYWNSVFVEDPIASVDHIFASVISAGATLANCYLGIYDVATGNQLGVTADISSLLTSIAPVSAQLVAPITGLKWNQHLYVAVLIGSAGTAPGFAGARANGGNLGQSTNYRIQVKTGSATVLPATVSTGLTLPGSGSFQSVGIGA